MRRLWDCIVSMDVIGYWNTVVLCGDDLPGLGTIRSALAAQLETWRVLPRVVLRNP